MVDEMFREYKGIEGRLMMANRDAQGNAHYQIWFDYTRELMNQIREGDLIAVQNFAPSDSGTVFSVLSLLSVQPIHYALGKTEADLKGYPGHVMEAAKNIAKDWKDQVHEPTEDVTKIICDAVPTFLELVDSPKTKSGDKPLREESGMPMPGEEAKLLARPMVQRIINLGLDRNDGRTVPVGTLIRDPEIEILTKVEDLLRVHFGIFGFTGVGKSNLLSTLIDRALKSKEKLKFVLFDIMDEYRGILFDLLARDDILVRILFLDTDSIPGPVVNYINQNYDQKCEKDAVDSFLRTLLLPKSLQAPEVLEAMRESVPKVLQRVRILPNTLTVRDFREAREDALFKGTSRPTVREQIQRSLDTIFKGKESQQLTPSLAQKIVEEGWGGLGGIPAICTEDTAKSRMLGVKSDLEKVSRESPVQLNESIVLGLEEMVEDINNPDRSSLYVVSAVDNDAVLDFCSDIAWRLYHTRRVRAQIGPTASLIADEADLFLPSTADKDTATLRAKSALEMIARRGRKFGIGVGLATQRAAYLDTKTMGQLHTYFISKLPRGYDREAVGNAFGLSDEQLSATFKFRSGEWLLISHDATGLKGVPVPMRAPNAEDRIRAHLGMKK